MFDFYKKVAPSDKKSLNELWQMNIMGAVLGKFILYMSEVGGFVYKQKRRNIIIVFVIILSMIIGGVI